MKRVLETTDDKSLAKNLKKCETKNFLSGYLFYILPSRFGPQRIKIFEKQITKFDGLLYTISKDNPDKVTHVVAEESVDKEALLQICDFKQFRNAVFLKSTWLTHCFKKNNLIPIENFIIYDNQKQTNDDTSLKDLTSKSSKQTGDDTSFKYFTSKSSKQTDDDTSFKDFTSKSSKQTDDDTSFKDFTSKSSKQTDDDTSFKDFTSKSSKQTDDDTSFKDFTSKSSNSSHTRIAKAHEISDSEDEDESDISSSDVIVSQVKIEDTADVQEFPLKHFAESDKTDIEKFACAHSSNSFPKNFNEHITKELEKLALAYESRKDRWRALGYQKAVSAIKSYPKRIETWEEAKSIRGVGVKLANKVQEIIESGQLRKVKEVYENEETKILQLFIGVWGAGPTTANNWYSQGYRTLDDLRANASLTRHQEIGLKYYEEINDRILRPEVEEIEKEVCSAAETIRKGLQLVTCGSYRRGKPSCGDVDILITHPDGVSHKNIFKPLLGALRDKGFLTDDLTVQENNGNQQKYLGVCKLPGSNTKHRRLDLIVVPFAEFAPAILYFTGSAHFNRSTRLLAVKLGMSLSEHGLRAKIVRDVKSSVTGGTLLHTPTEESIFKHLGLQYRPPNERDV